MLGSLPMALALALSPFAVIPAIVLLLTPRPAAAGGAFFGGWATGVATLMALAVVAADLADAGGAPRVWVDWARLLLGVALVVAGLTRWRRRESNASTPPWLQQVQTATPRQALLLGITLSVVNPKVVLLALAGSVAIGSAAAGPLHKVLAVLVFTAVASISVALPWLMFLAASQHALPMLVRLRAWLEAYAATLVAVVLVVLGVVLVANGFGALR